MKWLLVVLAGCVSSHRPTCASELGLQDEVKAFAGCTRVGQLVIRTGAPLDLAPLGELTEVTGDLVIGPTIAVDEIALGALVRVGGAVRIADNSSLQGLFLPRLETAGRVEIAGNLALSSIAMPRLTSVAGALVIADNHDLEFIQAEALARVGGQVVLERNPKLPQDQVDELRAKTATK